MRGIAGLLAAADLRTELEYLLAFLSACCLKESGRQLVEQCFRVDTMLLESISSVPLSGME